MQPHEQPLLRYVKWEDDLLSVIESELQVCRSDAQGIADARQDLMRHAWNAGHTAREAALQIIQSATQEDTSHD
jgi:hypothetical protein